MYFEGWKTDAIVTLIGDIARAYANDSFTIVIS